MKTKITLLTFAKVFFISDLCLIIFALLLYDETWLLNTQVAFIGSLFVTIASFLSYRRNIQNRLLNFEKKEYMDISDRDKIDEIDDPFDLYSEELKEIPEEELTSQKIKEIIKEEKSKVKKNSFKNTIFSAGGFISIYRVLGYLFLIFGFFALNNNKLFLAIPFFIGLSIVPLGTLISKVILNKK